MSEYKYYNNKKILKARANIQVFLFSGYEVDHQTVLWFNKQVFCSHLIVGNSNFLVSSILRTFG